MTQRVFYWFARRFFDVAFDRFRDQVLGAKSNRQRQRQDNTAKKNPESKLNDARSNSQVFERHREGQYDHDPFHPYAEEARVLKVQVNGANEHASAQKPSQNVTDEQNQ